VTALADLNRVINFAKFYNLQEVFVRRPFIIKMLDWYPGVKGETDVPITSFRILQMSVDKRLLGPIDVDLRVCIQWDTDMTDVELHVTYVFEKRFPRCHALPT
jgi:hypothetical protein